jgi:hypothetical protein
MWADVGIDLELIGLATVVASSLIFGWRINLGDLIGNTMLVIGLVIGGSLVIAAILAALTVWLAWFWWHDDDRRNRRRAIRELGAKSKARLAAIVKRARTASKGARPVLRPVQGGAS